MANTNIFFHRLPRAAWPGLSAGPDVRGSRGRPASSGPGFLVSCMCGVGRDPARWVGPFDSPSAGGRRASWPVVCWSSRHLVAVLMSISQLPCPDTGTDYGECCLTAPIGTSMFVSGRRCGEEDMAPRPWIQLRAFHDVNIRNIPGRR